MIVGKWVAHDKAGTILTNFDLTVDDLRPLLRINGWNGGTENKAKKFESIHYLKTGKKPERFEATAPEATTPEPAPPQAEPVKEPLPVANLPVEAVKHSLPALSAAQEQSRHIPDLESALLSAMLCFTDCIDRVTPIVTAVDLDNEDHRHIFRAIIAHHSSGQPVELPALAKTLDKNRETVDVLAGLANIAITGETAPYYAREVKRASNERNIQYLAIELQNHPERAAHILSKIEELTRPVDTINNRFDLSRLTLGSDISAGDYKVTWVVDKLIPENSITLFYAKGGSGKSTLATQFGSAVNSGLPFMGLQTSKRTVIMIDYENPLAVVKTRVDLVDGANKIYFWTGGNNPPQLNNSTWAELKDLIATLKNPLIIIDTLSSSCSGLDILSNSDYSPVMSKIIELRNIGSTLVLLHHTPKQDETKYIGASTIYNNVDHVIAMYPVKSAGAEKEVVDEDDAKVYRFGTKDKTRFAHFTMFVEFDEDKGLFVEAADPDKDILDRIASIISLQSPINQTSIMQQIGTAVPKAKLTRLLSHNEGRLWEVKRGEHNAKIYTPISAFQFSAPIGGGNWETENRFSSTLEKHGEVNTPRDSANSGLASYSTALQKTEKQAVIEDADFSEIVTLKESGFMGVTA